SSLVSPVTGRPCLSVTTAVSWTSSVFSWTLLWSLGSCFCWLYVTGCASRSRETAKRRLRTGLNILVGSPLGGRFLAATDSKMIDGRGQYGNASWQLALHRID